MKSHPDVKRLQWHKLQRGGPNSAQGGAEFCLARRQSLVAASV